MKKAYEILKREWLRFINLFKRKKYLIGVYYNGELVNQGTVDDDLLFTSIDIYDLLLEGVVTDPETDVSYLIGEEVTKEEIAPNEHHLLILDADKGVKEYYKLLEKYEV